VLRGGRKEEEQQQQEQEQQEEEASFLNHDFSSFDRFSFSLLQHHLITI